jgi:integral membrane sensor domain MASE1
MVIVVKAIAYKRVMKNEDIFSSIASLIKMTCLFAGLSVFAFFAILIFSHYYLVIPARLTNMVLLKWTGADLTGTLLFVPLILCIKRSDFKINSKVNDLEYYLLAAYTIMIGLTFFQHLLSPNILAVIIIPSLLFISFRYSILVVMIFTTIYYYFLNINLLMNIGFYKPDHYIAMVGFYQILFIVTLIGLIMINIKIGRNKKS